MKLALVSATVFGGFVGGVTNHIQFLAKELSSRGHELTLFKPVWDVEYEECVNRERDDGIEIVHVNLGRRPYDFRRWAGISIVGSAASILDRLARSKASRPLVEAVEKWDPDLVWQHDFSSTWIGVRKLSRRYPVVLTNHLGEYIMLQNRSLGRIMLPWLLSHYSAIIGPSKELTPQMSKNAHTVHNGVDMSHFQVPTPEKKSELKHKLFGVRDRWVVFCPRRLAPTKGVLYLAQAIRELDKNADARSSLLFVLAGTDYDEYPQYVEKTNSALAGLTVPVIKLGNVPVSKINEYYQASDLVVIPSLMEAVSLSALESMASGVPVLSTNVGGMPEIIIHGVTGYLVNPSSFQELQEAVLYIQRDPRRSLIAAQALELVRTRYSWAVIAEVTEEILRSAIDGFRECKR